ncbi:MAG: N-acetylmuramoyl-L-alanine amidase [Verrucomicrobiota bacterium]
MKMPRIRRSNLPTALAILAVVVFCGCETANRQTPEEPEVTPQMGEVAEPEPVPQQEPEPVIEEPKPSPPLVKREKPSLELQAKGVGAKVSRFGEKFWRLEKDDTYLELEEESRRAQLNGIAIYLSQPLKLSQGKWLLSKADVDTVLRPAFLGVEGSVRSRLIVLDPGHGGLENGAKNVDLGLLEKNLNLEVCNRLRTHLEAAGFRVMLTRYDDRILSLADRPEIANREGAGLFVSIHFNGSLNPDALGLETYVVTPAGEASTADETPEGDVSPFPGNAFDDLNFALGMRIQRTMIEKMGREDRGFRKARFGVLKRLECPGALVECGFLTNAGEALLVGTPVYREKISQAIAEAIVSFMEEFPAES